MNLEPGDYFIVTRGIRLRTQQNPFSAMLGESWKDSVAEPDYDRSHDGRLYHCLAVAHNHAACELVFPPILQEDYGFFTRSRQPNALSANGYPLGSLNLSEIEVMTVGKDYVHALGVTERPKPPLGDSPTARSGLAVQMLDTSVATRSRKE